MTTTTSLAARKEGTRLVISKPRRWLSWLLLAVLFGPVVVAGCVALPIKIGEEEALAGRRIGPKDVAFLKPGITTRDEVVSKLGAPTFDLSDLGILSYVWIELKEDWAIIWGLPPLACKSPACGCGRHSANRGLDTFRGNRRERLRRARGFGPT